MTPTNTLSSPSPMPAIVQQINALEATDGLPAWELADRLDHVQAVGNRLIVTFGGPPPPRPPRTKKPAPDSLLGGTMNAETAETVRVETGRPVAKASQKRAMVIPDLDPPFLPGGTPDLRWYDWIVVNSSAGKDSQAMLDRVVELATLQGVLYKVVVAHCDLGAMEWDGTLELAREQAAHYSLPFFVVRRRQGDLLHQIEFERGKFPGTDARFCTSDHKTSQVARLFTYLASLSSRCTLPNGQTLHLGRAVRILSCLGIRADESAARAKKEPFVLEKKPSNATKMVYKWMPIFGWTLEDVWARIRKAGTRHHPAYDADPQTGCDGLPRLSCCFCIFSHEKALVHAARKDRPLALRYLKVQNNTGHLLRQGLDMNDIIRKADDPNYQIGTIPTWEMPA